MRTNTKAQDKYLGNLHHQKGNFRLGVETIHKQKTNTKTNTSTDTSTNAKLKTNTMTQ